jgi:hypothetical protein
VALRGNQAATQCRTGYRYVTLSDAGHQRRAYVHVLVREAFGLD